MSQLSRIQRTVSNCGHGIGPGLREVGRGRNFFAASTGSNPPRLGSGYVLGTAGTPAGTERVAGEVIFCKLRHRTSGTCPGYVWGHHRDSLEAKGRAWHFSLVGFWQSSGFLKCDKTYTRPQRPARHASLTVRPWRRRSSRSILDPSRRRRVAAWIHVGAAASTRTLGVFVCLTVCADRLRLRPRRPPRRRMRTG